MDWLRRFDSLFTRLLLAQVALVMALGLLMGALFYVERNQTVARLYADRWAPALAQAAGVSSGTPAASSAHDLVQTRADAPESARHLSLAAPRFVAMQQALAERGILVDDLRLSLDGPESVLWLHVQRVGRAPIWLGVAGNLVVPEWSGRTLVALVLVLLLVVGASWTFTRRHTRPLERLRARMQTHAPGQAACPVGHSVGGTTPEIMAIDTAYSDLLSRQQRHERERAVLLAGVSHDLRSPLGRIRMAVELLPDSADTRARRESIVRNVAQADRLIESFLDFVRASTLVCDETVDLAAAARTVVAGFERPESELSVEAPPQLLWRRGNRLLVERLLLNLLDNALKHGRPPVRLVLGGDASQAWLEVSDAGDGMAADQVERLQEAFTRGDLSRSTTGSGLGLAIVRQVASRLGANLAFERQLGGQVVRVTLPAGAARD